MALAYLRVIVFLTAIKQKGELLGYFPSSSILLYTGV